MTQWCAGKLTAAETFRLGSIDHLFEDEMEALAEATHEVPHENCVELERA